MNKRRDIATLWRLFAVFFKAGAFTFAGGLAMLPIISRDVVTKYGMLEEEQFLEYAALSQTLPGVIAMNCAVFVGNAVAGLPGAIIGGLGAAIPALVAMLLMTMLVKSIPRQGWVEGAFKGIRAASAALILSAAITLGQKAIKGKFAVMIALVSFALLVLLKISAFPVVIAAGVAGIVYRFVRNQNKKAIAGNETDKTNEADETDKTDTADKRLTSVQEEKRPADEKISVPAVKNETKPEEGERR